MTNRYNYAWLLKSFHFTAGQNSIRYIKKTYIPHDRHCRQINAALVKSNKRHFKWCKKEAKISLVFCLTQQFVFLWLKNPYIPLHKNNRRKTMKIISTTLFIRWNFLGLFIFSSSFIWAPSIPYKNTIGVFVSDKHSLVAFRKFFS